ncbi:uncharacterized protein [Nicotiana tomentosiformis]|uniref:uncharacterized protein n=1 Tax=Nicotiana tomentosiformis TaxID=4098 RepID=UPI00388C6CC0
MNEDPNNHLMYFEEFMNTFQYNGVSQDVVYLRAFPFTLKDDAKHYLRSLPNASIRTWDEMTRKFLDKYFSSAKTDANQWPYESAERRRSIGVHQIDAKIFVQVQLDAMAKEIRKLTLASIHIGPHATCDICGRGHPTHNCQASIEEVNAVGNYNFNAMGQKHPGFLWSSPGGTANAWQQNNPRFQGALGFVNQPRPQFQPLQPIHPGFEDLIKSFIVKVDERLDAHGAAIKELGTGLQNLEKQVGQIAIVLSKRISVNVVTLRRGKVLKDPTLVQTEIVPEKEIEEQLKNEVDNKKKGKKGAEKKKKEETSEGRNLMRASIFLLYLFLKCYIEKSWTTYAKFMKEILTKKRKIEKTSCDFDASINLMPLCIYKKLENELGDIRFHCGEDGGEQRGTLILGRPLLATGRAILDIHDRKLMLRVGEETVTFDMNVEMGVRKKKLVASVEWRVKSLKEKVPMIDKDKCGVYPKKAKKKWSAWMCALVRARRMDPDFDSDPD